MSAGWASTASDAILEWFSPGVTGVTRATDGWALTRLDHAIYALIPYLVVVLVGVMNKPSAAKMKQQAKAAKAKREADKKNGVQREALSTEFAKNPIKFVQLIYNALQVALCGYMIYGAVNEYRAKNYTLICNKFNLRESGMAYWVWIFYLSKVFDFFDTSFMVINSKYNQFTFLHIYHHISIFLMYWVNINIAFDGDIYFTVVANAAVHFIMYFYYFLTTLRFRVPKPLKMLVTVSQMVQFICMNTQAIYILYNGCPFPARVTQVYLFYIISLFLLFGNFFLKSYCGGKKQKKQ